MIIKYKSSWKTMRVAGVTVSVQPKLKTPYSILRVASLIDTGRGNPTLILKNALPEAWEIDLDHPASKRGFCLPRKNGCVNLTYTGQKFGVIADVEETLRLLTRGARLAPIVTEVAAPGDFMIFRHDGPRYSARFAGVMRAIPLR
jgi:hypothetical protein